MVELEFDFLAVKMDESLLISGESSGGNGRQVGKRKEVHSYIRRSDAITHGSPYQRAAALVDLVSVRNLAEFREFCCELWFDQIVVLDSSLR